MDKTEDSQHAMRLGGFLCECVGCRACCASNVFCGLAILSVLFGILAKWSDLTRLETRTKESNMCASIRVANPSA
jgi:hypothetical protein